jgi:hypothetical protein
MIYKNLYGRRLVGRITCAIALAAAGALALAPTSASAATVSATPPKTVYAITFAGNSALYSLSPRSHKTARKGYTGAELTDITFRGKTLYAISFTDLYWINTATGASHHIGSLGLSTANALVTSRRRTRSTVPMRPGTSSRSIRRLATRLLSAPSAAASAPRET